MFIIAGILTAADKFIDKAYADQVKGWLKMTQVARLYEEEKIEALNQAARLHEEVKTEALNQAARLHEEEKIKAVSQEKKERHDEKLQIARNLVESGVDILTVMKSTGLTRGEIEGAAEAGMAAPNASNG